MIERREFPAKIKLAAWERCKNAKGIPSCEDCGARLYAGKFTYDHENPDYCGGEPTLENCRVRCSACDKTKLKTIDHPKIARVRRRLKTAAGVRRKPKGKRMSYRRDDVEAPTTELPMMLHRDGEASWELSIDGEHIKRLPKSLCAIEPADAEEGETVTVTLPYWLGRREGLI